MPTTDWQLVRNIISAAVDACEASELSRAITAAAALGAELVGATRLDDVPGAEAKSIRQTVEGVANWYRDQLPRQLAAAAAHRPAS